MYKIRKYRKSNDISAGNWLGQQLTWEGEREKDRGSERCIVCYCYKRDINLIINIYSHDG